jgi:hypothetical protein
MADSRMFEVAQELLRIAREGKAPWEQSSESSYRADVRGITLRISRSAPADYLLTLINDKGEDVESLYVSTTDRDNPAYPVLREIFSLARGQALDVEADLQIALDLLRST